MTRAFSSCCHQQLLCVHITASIDPGATTHAGVGSKLEPQNHIPCSLFCLFCGQPRSPGFDSHSHVCFASSGYDATTTSSTHVFQIAHKVSHALLQSSAFVRASFHNTIFGPLAERFGSTFACTCRQAKTVHLSVGRIGKKKRDQFLTCCLSLGHKMSEKSLSCNYKVIAINGFRHGGGPWFLCRELSCRLGRSRC